jgi:hypothetical protein
LKGVPIPTPSNLHEFIADRSAAIVLGKALGRVPGSGVARAEQAARDARFS